MAALTTQLVFPIVPAKRVYQNYETGNCDIQFLQTQTRNDSNNRYILLKFELFKF